MIILRRVFFTFLQDDGSKFLFSILFTAAFFDWNGTFLYAEVCTVQYSSSSKIEHIPGRYRWWSSVPNCRSYWSTFVASDHVPVLMGFLLRPNGHRCRLEVRLAVQRLSYSAFRAKYEQNLSDMLKTPTSRYVDEYLGEIKAIRFAAVFVCPPASNLHQVQCALEESLDLMEQKYQLPNSREMNNIRWLLRPQLTMSFKKDLKCYTGGGRTSASGFMCNKWTAHSYQKAGARPLANW